MRIDRSLMDQGYWARAFAEEVVKTFPDQELYTVCSGISPSGTVHFGNFREIMTQYAVKCELEKMGKRTRLVFVWDEFDRFRKVPAGVDASYQEHIGKPLTSVPDPSGCHPSWAKHFEEEFEVALKEIGIEVEYRYQADYYGSGGYDAAIERALKHRTRIAEILLSHMSEKSKELKEIDPELYKAEYFPISVYSHFTGKDTTKVLAAHETTIKYRCLETGKEQTFDYTKEHIVKFPWKVDWPMRWKDLGVVFESGGKDHLSPGGAYDVSSDIVREVFDGAPPLSIGYEFVGIQGLGAKMSGSKGNAVSPGQLLDIYEVPLLLWLYLRKLPTQRFDLAFDAEVIRQYSEFDKAVEGLHAGTLSEADVEALRLAGADTLSKNPIPFRQAIALGQIVQWDTLKVMHMLSSLGMDYDRASVEIRLGKARAYLEKYHPEEMVKLFDTVHEAYAGGMSEEQKALVQRLREVLTAGEDDIAKLEVLMYDIPKREGMGEEEKKKAQREFFKDVYQLLIGKDTGPRLSTFLWAADRDQVIKLLSV